MNRESFKKAKVIDKSANAIEINKHQWVQQLNMVNSGTEIEKELIHNIQNFIREECNKAIQVLNQMFNEV